MESHRTQHMSLWHLFVGIAAVLTFLISPIEASPALQKRGVGKLRQRATTKDLRYQPAMDFDTDGCYAVSAIDGNGNISPGIWTNGADLTSECREPDDLQNSNAYSRQRCNNGWCIYIYDYYFEKDASGSNVVGPGAGHRHDWEHIAIWVKGDQSGNEPASDRIVCASEHGGYSCEPGQRVLWHRGADGQETHAKIVYHKDGATTHAFRFAAGHDDPVENDSRQWFYGDLVSHNGYPNEAIRTKLFEHYFGSATMAVRDANFVGNIISSRPMLTCVPGEPECPGWFGWLFDFDPNLDADGSPGTPPPLPQIGQTLPGGGLPPIGDVPPPTARKGKMMIVGDSITHGQDGDFTWRYRLWQWLGNNGHDFTFVGPSSGTHGDPDPQSLRPRPPPWLPGATDVTFSDASGRYESSASLWFTESRHGARWGRQAKQVRPLIKQWCADHQPDYLLLLLGFNDLGWWVSGPEGLMDDMGHIVQHCREAKPNVQILVGNVIDRSRLKHRDDLIINTANYNSRLRDHITNWFRYESNIAYVDVNKAFNCRPDFCYDGYDGLHPDAKGEYHIAQAFAEVLKRSFGFQGSDFFSPNSVPGRKILDPNGLSISVVPEGFHLKWDQYNSAHPSPPRGYNIRSRIQGMSSWWSSGIVYPSGRESWQPWVLKDQTWEYEVEARGDHEATTAWSGTVSAKANPQTVRGPENIITSPSGNGGIQFTWSPVTVGNLNRYAVYVWDKDTDGSFLDVRGALGTSMYIGGLIPGHRYATWVATWVNLASGPAGGVPAAGREVYVSRGTPSGAPSNLAVSNIDPTTVRLTWNAVAGAAGYAIYYRNHKNNDPYILDRTSDTNSHETGFLFPGTWNYQFCVSAYNGDLESARSNCVIPAVFPGFSRRDEIPANTTEVAWNRTVIEAERMMQDEGLRAIYGLLFHNETALLE